MTDNRFRGFVVASGLTNLADGIATVAWAWLASLLTRDPLLIALVPVALRLPWFICAIPAGIVTDRVDRRRLILWMDVVRALAFLMAAVAVWVALPLVPPQAGVSQPALFGLIVIAALGVGVAEVFRDNAAQTMLPAIVPHADLEKANGQLWSVELVGNALLGPALGAVLISLALPLPFLLNGVAYGMAVVLVYRLAGQYRAQGTQSADWRREFLEGYRYLQAAPLLRALAWITGFWNLFFQMVMIALVLHVQENLGLDATAYGLILASGALGGIAGGVFANRIVARLGPQRTAQWMLVFSAPAFLGIALAPSAVALGAVLAVFEFTGLVWNTVSVSYRQRVIPDALLGRVNSLYRLLAWGMMPVGLLLSGVIVRAAQEVVDREVALILPFLVAALGALVLGLVGWRALRVGFSRV